MAYYHLQYVQQNRDTEQSDTLHDANINKIGEKKFENAICLFWQIAFENIVSFQTMVYSDKSFSWREKGVLKPHEKRGQSNGEMKKSWYV